MDKSAQKDLRYERKFLVEEFSFKQVDQIVKFHPACFKEIFHERFINNIYFDTPGFNNYYDNVEGERKRWKTRIRWYDELFTEIKSPTLEFKIKNGLMGNKDSYKLASFNFNKPQLPVTEIRKTILNSELPKNISDLVLSLKPTLLNRYKRKYFISADKRFRLTLDSELEYYSIMPFGAIFLNKFTQHNATVVELKYNLNSDINAADITSHFPFMLTKNSKYLVGLEKVML